MKTESLHGICGFVVVGVSFRRLCNCIAELPGVTFTDRRWFFWGSGDERAEFVFQGQAFTLFCDWEGDYWVKPKDETAFPPEMEVIRQHVVQYGSK